MSTFTIDNENNITAYQNATEASEAPDLAQFDSEAALAKLSTDWPMSRFVDIWNSIAGNTEISKFQDRKKAVARIWKAIQPLSGDSQPKTGKEANGAKPTKKSKTSKKVAPGRKVPSKGPDRTNKKAAIVAMMRRAKGATLAEIMAATGWQAHTVRGFVSILGSNGGETIESAKDAVGERRYKIAK